MNQLLTASRINCLQSCPRRHYWRYEVGLNSTSKSAALRIGSAWHNAMEARWQGADYDGALAAAIPEGIDLDELQVTTVAGLLAGYYRHYGASDALVKELHPEVEFRTPLQGSRSFDVAGKIDGLAVLHDGRIALMEHKTCGEDISPASDYWLRLRFNQQVLQYVMAARALQWPIEVVLYDVVRKPMIRPRQNETVEDFGKRLTEDTGTRPEFYFARREVPVLDQDLEEFRVQRLIISQTILTHRRAERSLARPDQAWPRIINMMACNNCEFSSFCLQNISVDTNNPPAGFTVGKPHQELAQV